MSPARTSLIDVRSLACICHSPVTTSVVCFAGLYTVSPAFSRPEYTRMNVSWPTTGSVAILNANAANGSLSLGARVPSPPSASTPRTAGRSAGAGR
jgi:hypothetical protein